MKKNEKIKFLIENHYSKWFETRKLVEEELSNSQILTCVCGRLATGFHEMYCSRFQKKVDSKTIEKLKGLL